jgi:CubicO group peptidase (beta-lactamase class C family)
MFTRFVSLMLFLAAVSSHSSASDRDIVKQIDAYLAPYVQSGNFSGTVLVEKRRHIVFLKGYGFADREHRVVNTKDTRFHIASVSMQFTATAVLRLVDEGQINLDSSLTTLLPGTPGAEKITVRDLLMERSGLPDINELPDYNEILQHHQTPASLVAKIEGRPLLFEPGSKYQHEEHSAYNVLALLVEKYTGVPFAQAVQGLVFHPKNLKSSGVDDDSVTPALDIALGYEPEGVSGLKPARTIHWSAKTGNASIYTTVTDESRFVDALFSAQLLRPSTLNLILDTSQRVGYGWFRGLNQRFGQAAFYMNGRAPGFASFVLYLPHDQTTVVVFSNIYSSATTSIGYDLAAIALRLPHDTFQPSDPAPSANVLKTCTGAFQFGPDFYQANAQVTVAANDRELSLQWPSAEVSPLIPMGNDRFMDRSYWEEVKIERNPAGQPIALLYGKFRGNTVAPPK